MKKFTSLIIALLVLCNIAYSTDGPVTTVGSPAICFGTAISIPVTVTQFTHVGAMYLTLNYNSSDLVYQEVSVNPDFSGVVIDGSIPGVFTLEWSDLTEPGISLELNEVLFTLTFTLATGFTQGSTELTWVEDPSSANLYSDPVGNEYDKFPFGSFFIGGMLTVHPLPVPGITGDNNPCPGLTGVQYSTEPGMSGYQWTVTGGTIVSGGCTGDNTVTVIWCTGESGEVTVNYTNSYGCTGVTSIAYPVTVKSPVAPGATWTGEDFTVPVSRDGCSAEVSWLTTVLDHNQTATRGNLGAWEFYQSITSGQTGLLTKISLNVVRTNENFRLKVYAGAGTSGELMFWGDYKTAPSAGWQDFILPQNAAPYIVSGDQYTLYFECLTKPYSASSWLAFGCNWIGDNLGCWIIGPIEPPLHCDCPVINANNNYWDNMPVYGIPPVGSEFSPSLVLQLKTWVSQLPLSITESCGFIKSVTVSDTSGSAFPLGETTVTYTVTNNGDQNVESFFDVFVETDLTGSAGNDGPVCEGTALTLTAGGGGGGGGYTYDWTGPDDSTYTGSPLVIPVATVAQHNGLWKVDITDIYDCTVRETTTVTVDALQVAADFTADSLLPLKYSTVQLTDLSTGGATGWEWSFDSDSVEYVNGTTENSQNPQVQFTDGGLYTVTLMVSNACGTDTEIKTDYIRAGRPGWWTGETSKNWHYSKNWDNHLVPGPGIDVIIPTIEPGCFNPKVPHNLVTNVDCSNLIFVGEAVLEIEGELIVNPGTEVIVKDSATIIFITP